MSCLNNLIAIKNQCKGVVSDSGLYFEDLPGVSLRKADNAMDERFNSGIDLVQQKVNMAQTYIENRVRSFFDTKIQTTSVVENDVLGIFKDNLREIAPTPLWKGIQLDMRNVPYLKLFLSRIKLFSNYTGTVPVHVYDLITGKSICQIDIEAVAGEKVSLDTHKIFQNEGNLLNLFIAYDASLIESYETHLTASFKNCYSCRNNFTYHNKLYAKAGKLSLGSEIIDRNVKSISDTGGLSITYSLQCASDNAICSVKNLLAWPILYKSGELVLQEMIYSERLNKTITIYGDDYADLREEFEEEFEDSLKEILGNMKIPTNECFKCKPRIGSRVRIP